MFDLNTFGTISYALVAADIERLGLFDSHHKVKAQVPLKSKKTGLVIGSAIKSEPYSIVDIGGYGLEQAKLFNIFNYKKWTLIDMDLDDIDLSKYEDLKRVHVVIDPDGFPTTMYKDMEKSIAIAICSLTMYDQYKQDFIINALSKAPHLYISIPIDDLSVFHKYLDTFGHANCVYERTYNGRTDLMLMHYWH